MQENMIFSQKEGGISRQKILVQLKSLRQLLARKQAVIKQLERKDAKLGGKNAKLNEKVKEQSLVVKNLMKMVNFLNAQLEEKVQQVERLTKIAQTRELTVNDLSEDVMNLTDEADNLKAMNELQKEQMNTAYYIVADKKELKDLGLLKGGFLKKKTINYDNLDKGRFKRVDVRQFSELTIDSDSPKLMTNHPSKSYKLETGNDGTSRLIILDSSSFWSVSNYLVIKK